MVGSTTGTTRFHKAAQDGILEILREATKRDCNTKDEDGMTPTLWAAFQGNLEALRLLVGRGGDPEKVNYHFGQTALHIAAGRGHLNCVSFLVGFEANLWALDHDLHTPIELAAMTGKKEIIEFLDKAAVKQEMTNKKRVELKKEKAIKDAEKHRKKYEDRIKREREKEKKQIKRVEKDYLGHKINEDTPIPTIQGKRNGFFHEPQNQTFTQLVGGTMCRKQSTGVSVGVKKIIDRKLKNGGSQGKSSSNENSLRSESNGISKSKDQQIIYVNSYENQNGGKRGKISDVFETRELFRSKSQPDIMRGLPPPNQSDHYDGGSMFDRPGFGSVAFRQNINATLNGLPVAKTEEDSSIGSAGSLVKRNTPSHLSWENEDLRVSDEENSVDTKWLAMKRFLVAAGVDEYTSQFVSQRIDLEALLILNDEDLKELDIPMGPRKKLMRAVEDRKKALENPGEFVDSRL